MQNGIELEGQLTASRQQFGPIDKFSIPSAFPVSLQEPKEDADEGALARRY